MAIKAIIFDFGGVLIRDEDSSRRTLWEQRLGLPAGRLSELIFFSEMSQQAMMGEVPVSALWDYVVEQVNLPVAEREQLMRDFWWGDRLNTELLAFLEALHARYQTAILSNAWSNARQLFTEEFGFAPLVEEMIISAEVGLAKPDPRIYELALARLRVAPEEAIFIDDMLENVEAARDLGIRAVHFQENAATIAAVRALLGD